MRLIRFGGRDEDFAKFNERAEEMEELKGQLKQMFYRLQSYEATSKELDEQGRYVASFIKSRASILTHHLSTDATAVKSSPSKPASINNNNSNNHPRLITCQTSSRC